VPTSVILQFVSTFGVWIAAERMGLSAVLTMVCYAVTVSRRAPAWTPARLRVPSYAVWESAVFVLNVLAFVFIGLQIRPILETLEPAMQTRYLAIAGSVLLTVVVVRIAWVMLCTGVLRRIARYRGSKGFIPTVGGSVVVSWCGMRGIVTLAAALALPSLPDGQSFPYRDLIVFSSFAVVIGTLLVQGLTLRPLMLALRLRDDNPVAREVGRARVRALHAAIGSLDRDNTEAAAVVRVELEARLEIDGDQDDSRVARTPHDRLRRRAVAAARRELLQMRDETVIGDDAFHVIEEELDWLEMSGTVHAPSSSKSES
jgi:CPA1 family monovalent cation:H+ antiporter